MVGLQKHIKNSSHFAAEFSYHEWHVLTYKTNLGVFWLPSFWTIGDIWVEYLRYVNNFINIWLFWKITEWISLYNIPLFRFWCCHLNFAIVSCRNLIKYLTRSLKDNFYNQNCNRIVVCDNPRQRSACYTVMLIFRFA